MFVVDRIVLVAAILLLLGIASSKFSARLGLPVLVLFLVVGMLAGSEGIGGVEFDNFPLAHGIGTVALGVILFDGGLRTPISSIRIAWKPAFLLATVGVLGTSLITGFAASWLLGIPLLEGLLIGSIVGSTDAAAVFAVLRSAGVNLREDLAATLEVESGSNDPMAIFLTVGVLELLLGNIEPGLDLIWLFVEQMGIGMVVGLLVSWLAVKLINRINLEAAGLYPVLTGACGMLAYAVAANIGGSGFLAVYIAGIVLGNSRLVFGRGTMLFHDGLAWAGQITMFVVLGLLSFPSRLAEIATGGILVAAVLILVARPLVVYPLLIPLRYNLRETTLIAWVGLKGAVPIVLATFPFLFGYPNGTGVFNVVFFVVLISAITQGWPLPFIARKLGLQEEVGPKPSVTLEITSLRDVDADIVEYTVGTETRASGKKLNQLALPEGVVVAMISRGKDLIPPRGSTRIQAEDHVFVVLRPETRPLVDRVFAPDQTKQQDLPTLVEFPLMGSTTAEELREFYGIQLPIPPDRTLDELIRHELGDQLSEQGSIQVDGFVLRVREVSDGRVISVGLAIPDA